MAGRSHPNASDSDAIVFSVTFCLPPRLERGAAVRPRSARRPRPASTPLARVRHARFVRRSRCSPAGRMQRRDSRPMPQLHARRIPVRELDPDSAESGNDIAQRISAQRERISRRHQPPSLVSLNDVGRSSALKRKPMLRPAQQRASGNHLVSGHELARSRTPGASPFVNSTPAASRAARMAANRSTIGAIGRGFMTRPESSKCQMT
jgi:hypothetical protein